MGSDWALANLVDVNVTYTAESGMGSSLSVVAIYFSVKCSTYQYQCVPSKSFFAVKVND